MSLSSMGIVIGIGVFLETFEVLVTKWRGIQRRKLQKSERLQIHFMIALDKHHLIVVCDFL